MDEQKITEELMIANIIALFENLSPVEMVEEYNRMFGTDFIVDNVEWME